MPLPLLVTSALVHLMDLRKPAGRTSRQDRINIKQHRTNFPDSLRHLIVGRVSHRWLVSAFNAEICIFSGLRKTFTSSWVCLSLEQGPLMLPRSTLGHVLVPCVEDRKDVVDIRPTNTKESTHLVYAANKQFEKRKTQLHSIIR